TRPGPSEALKKRTKAIFQKATFAGQPRTQAMEFRERIRGASIQTQPSGQISTLNGAAQRASQTLKDKINEANLRTKPGGIRGSTPKLKAAPKLI
ncbi:hypothetical protein LCGC14_2875080, partial [marine sediment metagenome]